MEVVKPVPRSKPDRAEKYYSKFRNESEEPPKTGITAHDAWGHQLFVCKAFDISKARAEAREYNLTKAGVGQYAAYLRCYGKDYAV